MGKPSTIGHEYRNGKRVSIKKQFLGKSKTEAERRYREYRDEQTRLKYEKAVESSTATFRQRADDFVENVLKVSQKYSTGTKSRYIQSYEYHIRSCPLADTVLQDIKAADIQKFYNDLDISCQTLKAIHKFMSVFYKWAALNEYAVNVLTAVELPMKPDNSRHDDIVVWEDDEIRAILDGMDASLESSRPHRQYFLVYLLLYTGMRIGEALGLKYSDIRDGVIHVERQIYLGELKPPKWNSKRQIPMHEDLKKAFEIHKAWHKEDMLDNLYLSDFIFTTKNGTPYNPKNVSRALYRFYDRIDVPHKNIHVYRATFCTNLCRCGAPLEVTSKLLGHKSLEVTAAHYAFVRQDTKQDVIQMLRYPVSEL